MSLIAELKRRNVFRVGAAYVIVAWILIEVASVVLPTFEAPEWVMKVVIFLAALGFPLALVVAWAFELTPEGIKREEEVDRLLRGQVFVDLHSIVRQGVRAAVESYSLKNLEEYCGFERQLDLSELLAHVERGEVHGLAPFELERDLGQTGAGRAAQIADAGDDADEAGLAEFQPFDDHPHQRRRGGGNMRNQYRHAGAGVGGERSEARSGF